MAQDIQALIASCQPPYIEIAGPSPDGYQFLQALGLQLPAKITVTNASTPITLNPFGDNPLAYKVDAVVNVRQLPYAPQSVGIILASSLPLYSDHDTAQKAVALQEYDQADVVQVAPSEVKNLHIALLLEAARALRPQGLLIIENTNPGDTPIALKLGFRPQLDAAAEATYFSQIYLAR